MSLKSIKSWWLDRCADSFVGFPEVEQKKEIVLHLLGFDLLNSKDPSLTVLWSNVTSINAFKKDLFSIDLVCFEFHQINSNPVVEVNEKNKGFPLLEEALINQFQDFDADWRDKVMKPAFVTNLTTIWKKKCDAPRPPLH